MTDNQISELGLFERTRFHFPLRFRLICIFYPVYPCLTLTFIAIGGYPSSVAGAAALEGPITLKTITQRFALKVPREEKPAF